MPAKRLTVLLATTLLAPIALTACASEEIADCEAATQKVAACYGADVAEGFAETCDAELAEVALEENCEAGGKADGFGTFINPDRVEHFKYGSIGADYQGIPLAMFRALPLVCEDRWRELGAQPASADPLDQPYRAFGMNYEPGYDVPIGMSTRRLPLLGTKLVGPNCALCHNATVRETASSEPVSYLAAPNTGFDIESYNRFLLGCILSDDFNTRNLKAAFSKIGERSFFLPFLARFLQIFVGDMQVQFDSIVSDGAWGPGRDDAIGLTAAFLLGPEFLPELPAPVDFPSSWNQGVRQGGRLHWDGAAGSAEERNVLVATGAGTPAHKVPFASIDAIQEWLEELPPPAYPFEVDNAMAARGAELFEARCAGCHDSGGDRFGEVVDLAEIGTDPNRVGVTNQRAIDELNSLSGPGWEFGGFEKTNGYVNSLLDGIWLRAPYLHNGSVPSLRSLLCPPSQRPTTFYRGYNVFDKDDVGYVSNVAPRPARTAFGLFDTRRSGNGNSGHDYGTDLPESDKGALLEYMKTL